MSRLRLRLPICAIASVTLLLGASLQRATAAESPPLGKWAFSERSQHVYLQLQHVSTTSTVNTGQTTYTSTSSYLELVGLTFKDGAQTCAEWLPIRAWGHAFRDADRFYLISGSITAAAIEVELSRGGEFLVQPCMDPFLGHRFVLHHVAG